MAKSKADEEREGSEDEINKIKGWTREDDEENTIVIETEENGDVPANNDTEEEKKAKPMEEEEDIDPPNAFMVGVQEDHHGHP